MSDLVFDDYMIELFGGEDELLRTMREEAVSLGVPTIQVPLEVGRLLQLMVTQLDARRVLEIGTLFGYSTVLLAKAMNPDGFLISLEANPVHARLARQNVKRAGVAERVEIRVGAAADSLTRLSGERFDLVFIDADKESYLTYLKSSLALTRPGSVIIADNLWRGGAVSTPNPDDRVIAEIREFNRQVAQDDRLKTTFIPTRGGNDAVSVSVVL
jgi:predicted O-methyltransferase YrrM